MPWDDNLLPEQRIAAAHSGNHARLLAGPGTGKTLTLTRHICFLVAEQGVPAHSILAVTFTRAAARELRQRVENELGTENCPRVFTLHSFALRQLMRNARLITELPQPLRIADDWEERSVILEDIKRLLNLRRVSDAQGLLNELSADWQTLTADEAEWDRRFPNPGFLGAWREHRQIYGYTLRAELVYQLKRVQETRGDFELEGPIANLLVDEYQDLNRCDLAVIHEIVSRDVELFVAGDDDQSIYGFRKAHPEGIRRFPYDYEGAEDMSLQICKRCDRDILDISLFVARQDTRRIEKAIRSEPERGDGEVAILRFNNQTMEARGIARLCSHLIERHSLDPSDILVLLRSDHNGVFSSLIREKIEETDIPVSATTDTDSSLNTNDGRVLLAYTRLAINREDCLSWRTLLQVWCHGVGMGAIDTLYDMARSCGQTFAQVILAVHEDAEILPSSHRSRLSDAIRHVIDKVEELFPPESLEERDRREDILGVVQSAADALIQNNALRESVLLEFRRVAGAVEVKSVEELVRMIEVASEDIEQELEEGKINILTMHRAKGLTAQAVIIAAAEDQYLPGRAHGGGVDDERRLLYVSLTRAKHHLFVTYCDQRTGPQQYTGRDSGRTTRSLTRFLTDCPHRPKDGRTFLRVLAEETE